jgi:hypothetical protein
MRRPAADRESNTSGRLSLLRCEQLVRYAIDRLAIEGASRLSPHDAGGRLQRLPSSRKSARGLEKRSDG